MTTPSPDRRAPRPRLWWSIAVGLVAMLVAGACTGTGDDVAEPGGEPDPSTPTATGVGPATELPAPDTGDGHSIRLSAGRARPGRSTEPATEVVDGVAVDEARRREILDRLPEWTVPAETTAFVRPVESRPPPIAGEIVPAPFPGPSNTPTAEVASGALEVLRFQPEGDVALAPSMSVTFSQPMVAVATLDALDGLDIPVTMTPQVDGRWQWIGTRTLRFEAASDEVDRLPMATEFTVEIPVGTRSATGGILAETVRWSFATPAAEPVTVEPVHNALGLEPIFFLGFDQLVDPQAILAVTQLRTRTGTPIGLRLATGSEVQGDEVVADLARQALDGRWLAVTPVAALDPDTRLELRVGPGVPSLEGPRTSTEVTSRRGGTYTPFVLSDNSCKASRPCEPLSSLALEFNNPLDPELFDTSLFAVEPALDELSVEFWGPTVLISGATVGRTDYEVTIDRSLTDVFGQTLADDETATFRIGDAAPRLFGLGRPMITLDPLAKSQSVSFGSIGHEDLAVRVYRVEADAWADAVERIREPERFLGDDGRISVPGDWRQALETTVRVDGDVNALTRTDIDLAEVLSGGPGQLVVIVEPTEPLNPQDQDYWANRPSIAWVQSTVLGIDAVADGRELVVHTTDLRDGVPIGGVDVAIFGTDVVATTDEHGIARVDLPAEVGGDRAERSGRALVASQGGDVVILAGEYLDGRWTASKSSDTTRWYVADDRGIYRPGETVRLKAWVRRLTTTGDAQIELLGGDPELSWTLFDAQRNELASGIDSLNALGGFDLTVELPVDANLGTAWIDFELDGIEGIPVQSSGHAFLIEEFRRPEFEITAAAQDPGPYLRTDPATLIADAHYYTGGALGDTAVSWSVTTDEATYSPPGWGDYAFGVWQPWWIESGFDSGCCQGPREPLAYEEFTDRTDHEGISYLQIDFESPAVDRPVTVTAQAVVADVNRQAFAASAALLVHPARTYVGLASKAVFVAKGDPLVIDAIAADIDGDVVAGASIVVEASRMEWGIHDGEYSALPVDTQRCEVLSGNDPATCEFATSQGGEYKIVAVVSDSEGAKNRTEITRWVAGDLIAPPAGVEAQALTLVPDADTYAPGDRAEVLVAAPFATGHGVLTTLRNGIEHVETFTVDGGSAVISVDIEDAHIPGIEVQVDVVGVAPRVDGSGRELDGAAERPAYATGRIELPVPPTTRTLVVDIEPAAETVEPGTDTSIAVTVTGPDGEPVEGAEMAAIVIDEAVLALTGYELPNPLDVFYAPLRGQTESSYSRADIVLADLQSLLGAARQSDDDSSAASGDGAFEESSQPLGPAQRDLFDSSAQTSEGGAERPAPRPTPGAAGDTPIEVRSDFAALATFDPEVVTNARGRATIAVTLPDNLTRYRVMIIAADGDDHFGSAESNITARLPVMVRPSAPRFLRFGDRFELPVVVHNQTGADLDVDVIVEGVNLAFVGDAGRTVSVPANDRVEVRFPVETVQAGTARFRVAGVSGSHADAATIEVEVHTPSTAEAFATYGVLDSGTVAQPVTAPQAVFPQFGGLEVTTSTTALSTLTDAVAYISDYPYASSDAVAGRIMAISSLRDLLSAFKAEGLPSAAELNATVDADIAALVRLQNGDGGFGAWGADRPSDPFHSIQATHALVMASNGGASVPAETLRRAERYLADIDEQIPRNYGRMVRNTLQAYALHVRDLAGDTDTAAAKALYRKAGDGLGLDALAWLWPVIGDGSIDDEIERTFVNRATETAGAATFTTDYADQGHLLLHSDRRTDGIILSALIAQRPNSELIPKVVAGLLANRKAGRWSNISENTFILLAMQRYFDAFEAVTPDLVARVWLGELYAGEHRFEGRSSDSVETFVPMADIIEGGDQRLVVANDGVGRLYYRIGLRYAPIDFDLDALDRGFVVQRTYEAVDDPTDVHLDDDGIWQVTAGANVRVRLTMVVDSRRTNMALIDPLPAGFEAASPSLMTTPQVPDPELFGVDEARTWWPGRWYDHENYRDDRVEAFSAHLGAGTYDYSYVVRATTPGTFVVPPTRAEEIYAPETFGRSASATVVIG